MDEVWVATLNAITPDEAHGFVVRGRDIVLCNVEGEIYALQGLCTHEDLPLDGGEIEDWVLTCEWHGAQFDVCSGAVCALPATRPLKTYETRVENGEVYVCLED